MRAANVCSDKGNRLTKRDEAEAKKEILCERTKKKKIVLPGSECHYQRQGNEWCGVERAAAAPVAARMFTKCRPPGNQGTRTANMCETAQAEVVDFPTFSCVGGRWWGLLLCDERAAPYSQTRWQHTLVSSFSYRAAMTQP